LNNIISSSKNENKINKRLNDYTLNAFKEAKNKPSDVRKPKHSIKEAARARGAPRLLLNKIVKASLNEGEINKRLDQAAYAAINGQRQQERATPEGITMLGQLNREKPLNAITREMIQEYQEEQQAPIMDDGEARKYKKSDYEVILQVPVEIEDLKNEIRTIYRNRVATAETIKNLDENFKALNDYYKVLQRDIRSFGLIPDIKRELTENEKARYELSQERLKLLNDIEKYNFAIEQKMKEGREIVRQNSLIPEQNKEEIKKYEQSLKDLNRNRLNLQQQPNESELEYYKRLQEVEKEKYDPILYKKYASNQLTKKLNTKLSDLYDDTSFKEEIIKNLSDEEKFSINKDFNLIEPLYLNKNGFNNKSLNPKMAAQELRNALNTIKTQETLNKLKEEQGAVNIQSVLRGHIGRKKARETKEAERIKSRDAEFEASRIRDNATLVREDASRFLEEEARRPIKAATNIQRIVRGDQARIKAALIRNKNRINARNEEKTFYDNADKKLLIEMAQQQKEEIRKAREEKEKQERITAQQKELSSIRKEQQAKFNAKELLKSVLDRQVLRNATIERIKENRAIEDEKQRKRILSDSLKYMRIQEPYLKDIEMRIPYLEAYMKDIKEKQEREIAPQREAINREIASNIINTSLKEVKSEKERTNKNRQLIKEYLQSQKQLEEEINKTFLSEATTANQEEDRIIARLRKERSDIGKSRDPYKTQKIKQIEELMRKAKERKEENLINASIKASQVREEREAREPISPSSQVIQRLPNPVGRPRKPRNPVGRPPKKRDEGPAGAGLKGRARKPNKRIVKTSKEDKMKNRLRLVASQIEAGNTNPKLIKEVNELYKTLYDIDNAYMLLKK
jgi:hypothetical protein